MAKAKIGLTAGIGCGKSLIARVFENLGISVFYSDKEAKRLYDNPLFLQEIVKRFGESVIENGEFQARRLADIVFNDKNKLQELNELIHPKVFEIFDQWSEKQKSPYVIMESAILFENGLQDNKYKHSGRYCYKASDGKRCLQQRTSLCKDGKSDATK